MNIFIYIYVYDIDCCCVGLLIGLVGSLGCSLLQFVFPSLFYLKIYKQQLNVFLLMLLVFYILFGIVGGIFGTIQVIQKIIALYRWIIKHEKIMWMKVCLQIKEQLNK